MEAPTRSSKRKRTVIETYSDVGKQGKVAKSIKKHIEIQSALLTKREISTCASLGIPHKTWTDFINFCNGCTFYDRYRHSTFHSLLKESLVENNFVLSKRKDSGNKQRTHLIKQTLTPRKMVEEDWTEFFIFKEALNTYCIYRILFVEFRAVMLTLFTSQTEWMKSNAPESNIPSFILRGCLAFFPERTKELIPNINHSFYEMGTSVHATVDIFKMIFDYGSVVNNILVKEAIDDEEEKREEEEEEEERESRRNTNPNSPSEESINDEEFQDAVSVMHSVSSNTLSSLSSLHFSTCSVDDQGRLIGISENDKLYSRYFYLLLPTEKVTYKNGTTTNVHPYDLGLYIFTEAKKLALNSGKHVSLCYQECIERFKAEDLSKQNQVFAYLGSIKRHIFGKNENKFNMSHIIMAEQIANRAKKPKDVTKLFYTVKETKQDSIILCFDKSKCAVLDVYMAFEYLNIKYRKLLNMNVKKSIEWNASEILVLVDKRQYEVLVKTIMFFEVVKTREFSPPIYPIVAQRFLYGTPPEMSHSVNVILKLIRNTSIRGNGGTRWISHGNSEECTFLKLLPNILKHYYSFDYLWRALVRPFSSPMNLVCGPTDRWKKEQVASDANSKRFLERFQKGMLKINWGPSGFDIEACNIYLGLESFFAIRSAHMMQFYALKRLMTFIASVDWFQCEYPELVGALIKVMNGDYVKDIFRYSDSDMVDLPFDVFGSKCYDPDKYEGVEEYGIGKFLHVQLYRSITDHRMDPNIAIQVFESTVMKNHRFDEQTRKNFAAKKDTKLLDSISNMRDNIKAELKAKGCFKEEYELNYNVEEDSPYPTPDGADFFAFLIESLERLSCYHTDLKTDVPKEEDRNYRGYQKQMPENGERWLPFDNGLIKKEDRIWQIPISFDGERAIYSDCFIPTIWTLSNKYSGSRKLLRSRSTLRFSPKLTSLMSADPQFLNCLICYPITAL